MTLRWRHRLALDGAACLVVVLVGSWFVMFRMPGTPYTGDVPALDGQQRATQERLRRDVSTLVEEAPKRDIWHPDSYRAAREFIERRLREAGYEPELETFDVRGTSCANVVATVRGETRPEEVVIVGAHYDAVPPSPGADDNASGVAGLLELARRFADADLPRTLRLVFFANEEAPQFHSPAMGSYRHARDARREGTDVVAMLSLEMLGYYSTEPDSQRYPPVVSWFYPDRGDFIAFVGDIGSRRTVHGTIAAFRRHADVPSYGIAGPSFVPGVWRSDHSSFWEFDYPALMVTDTAYLRNPHYHRPSDTLDTLDWERFARVVDGLHPTVSSLAHPNR